MNIKVEAKNFYMKNAFWMEWFSVFDITITFFCLQTTETISLRTENAAAINGGQCFTRK